jgi:O-antigen/teichoic acid export membrane protein
MSEPRVGEGDIEFEDVPLLETPHPSPADRGRSGFATRVASIFATRVVTLGLTMFTSLLLAKLLGPTLRGQYSIVVTLPGMLGAVSLLGLPNAVNYFAGRGSRLASLTRATAIFVAVISVSTMVVVWLALPFLESTVLKGGPDDMLRVIIVTLPLSAIGAFGGTILYGRQQVKVYNVILVLQSITSLLGAVVLVGIFRFQVPGAVATSVLMNLLVAVGVTVEVARLQRRDRGGEPAPMRGLLGYAVRVYPASITGYFNARADVYIIQLLAATKEIADLRVGLYGFAVTMAEIVFYVPESVASMFLPRVASTSREESSAMLGRISRMTLLITVLTAIALLPVAFLGIHLVLGKYVDSLPAFAAILPGVVSLSLAKVMTSYLGGRGKPVPISVASSVSLGVNVVANLVLIPEFGIVGAALSSVVSYSVLAAIVVRMASRESGRSIRELCVPGPAEVRLLFDGGVRFAGALARRIRGGAAEPGPADR